MSVMHGDHAHGAGHGHDGHDLHGEHPQFLEHHFETPNQQFNSDKLGMWLFLATEVLLFAGLFCAYSVYRGNHPEIFVYAHQYLNKFYGGLNTVVLLFSSFTVAWAVRATQLNQRMLAAALLAITLLCAFTFMGIKFIEYRHKIHDGLLWGTHYNPHSEEGEAGTAAAPPVETAAVAATPATGAEAAADATLVASGALAIDRSKIGPAASPPAGLSHEYLDEAKKVPVEHSFGDEPRNVQTFFAVYFVMTGLHGVHVLAGIIAITCCLVFTLKGKYSAEWYTPVDLVALYWHIVDLVWIFLFPLLYLIH